MTDTTPYGRRFAASLIALLMVTSVLSPIGIVAAASGVSVSHATSQTTADPGDTVTITATFVQNEANSPSMEPDIPDGWSITQTTAGTDWNWFSGQQVFLGSLALSDQDGVNGTYTHTYTVQVPNDASPGDYTISSEGSVIEPASGNSLEDTASTTVTVPNNPPTIDAISDQTVDEGDSTTVSVSASDPDNGDSVSSLTLTQSPGFVSLSNGEISIAPQTGDADNSPYTVTVEATDQNGGTTTESFQVTVNEVTTNNPPTIDAISDQTVTEGDSTTVSVTTNDQDGDSVSLSLTQSPGFVSLSNGEISIDPQAGDAANSPYTVTVEADDGTDTTTESFQVTVEEPEPNTAPTIDAITDQGVSQGGSTTASVSASDADSGDSLSLSVSSGPSWITISDNGDGTGTVNIDPGTGVSVGTYTVEVTVSDGQDSATEEFAVYVDEPDQDGTVVAAINAGGPEFTAGDGTVYEADSANQYYTGGSTTTTGQAGIPTDPEIENTDDDTLYQSERWSGSGSSTLGYNIPISESGTYEVTLQFAEIYQGVSSNDDPDSAGPTDGTDENDRQFDIALEGQTVLTSYDIFSEVGPLAASDKTYTVEVTDGTLDIDFTDVTNNAKISAIKVEQLSVQNQPPTIDAIADQTVDEDDSTTVSVSASDPDGDSVSLSLTQSPGFVSFSNGEISIEPQAGDADNSPYTVTVEADDGTDTTTESFQVTVNEPANTAPTIDAISDQTVEEGNSTTVSVSASDQDGDSVSLSLTQSPGFVSFSNGEISIDPQAGDAANSPYTIEVTADDGNGGTAIETFTVTVEPLATNPSVSISQSVTSSTPVAPGDTVTIEATIDYSDVNAPAIDATLPSGWTVTSQDPDGGSYQPSEIQWLWQEGDADGVSGSHTVTYTVQVPNDATSGDYTFSAEGSAIDPADGSSVSDTSDVSVTVEGPVPVGSALVEITPDSGVDTSTFGGGTYQVTNTGEKDIASVSFDLSTATLPDMVFDPQGTAGDPTGEGLNIVSEGGTGITTQPGSGDAFSQPHNGQNADDGYDVMTVEFNDFQPGETATFWADNDPTSIKGANIGSQEAGPVSGLELARSTVTVTYEDGTTQTTQLMGDGSGGGSTAVVTGDEAPAPTIGVQGVSLDSSVLDGYHSGATVSSAGQTITVTGQPGETITLVRVEAELTLTNVPDADNDGEPGYDIEDLEANNAEVVEYYTVTLDSNGEGTVPVTLTNTNTDGDNNAGYNYFVAAQGQASGDMGLASNVVVLEYQPEPVNTEPTIEAITDQGVSEGDSMTVAVTASDADNGDTPSLSLDDAPGFVTLTDNGDGTGTITIEPGTGTVGTYTVTVNASDGQDSATEEFAVYVDEPDQDGQVIFATNAGGPEFTATDGTTFQEDTNFAGGSTFATNGAGTPAGPEIANTDDDTLYQSERYGDFSYDIPVPKSDTYEVTLKFAEIFQGVSPNDSPDSSGPTDGTNENDRRFNVTIEGQQVISKYDIFSEVGPLTASDKTYTVEVTDGTLNVEFSTVNDNAKISAIKVEQLIQPPIADAGADQTVDEGDMVTLDASGSSDPDSDMLSYMWTQTAGPSVSLSDATAEQPTFTAPAVDSDTTLTFEVKVTDDDGATDTDTVNVTVQAVNEAPTASFTVSPSAPEAGQTVSFDASGSNDPDGSIQSYQWMIETAGGQTTTLLESDFEEGSLSAAGWSHVPDSPDAGAGVSDATANSGTQSAFHNGGAGALVSPMVDASNAKTVTIAYWIQKGDDSFSENPDADAPEDLIVEYLSDDGSWIEIDRAESTLPNGEIVTESVPLTAENALHDDLQLRFRQEGGSAANGDFWHVDDVEITAESVTMKTGETVTNTFGSPGTYNVSLTVTDDEGASDTTTKSVTVSPPPSGSLTFNDQPLGTDDTVTVENVSTSHPSTVVVTYTNESGSVIVAGIASADNLNGEDVSVTIQDAGGFPGEHTAWVFADDDLAGLNLAPGDDVLATTGLSASEVQDLALDVDSAAVTLQPIGIFENPPTDPDNDGKYEDVNGDGSVNVGDVQALFANKLDPVVQNNVAAFDFNGDGEVNVGDVQALFAKGIGV